MTLNELLARQLDDTRDWTLKLLADLSGDEWTFQPAAGLAHPLWLCGHLASAENLLIQVRCLGKAGLDAGFTAHFPIGAPVVGAAAHQYPAPDEVMSRMAEVHKSVLEDIRGMSAAQLAEPCAGKDGQPHPHYTDKAGAICHAARHEAFHAGQLATIRRLLGKPFLR